MGFGDILPLVGAGAGAILGGPMGAGVGMAAGGALSGLMSGGPPQTAKPYQVDPALYDTTLLQGMANGFGNTGADWTPATDYAMANADRAMSLQARRGQEGLAADLEAVLRGERVSLAQQQLVEGQARAANLSDNLAANARGGAGAQILAQQNAMRQGAASALETNRISGLQRAQEEAAARGQLAGVLGQMRGQDLDTRGGSQGQAQFKTQSELANRAQDNEQARYFASLQLQAQQAVAQTKQAQAAAQQGAYQSSQGLEAQQAQAAYQAQQQRTQGYVNGGASLMTLGMQGGGGSKPPTNPSNPADPYGINNPGF